MISFLKSILISLIGLAAVFGQVRSQESASAKTKALHAIGTAHFDTQWRWTIQTSINEYIPSTFNENFQLFEKYPGDWTWLPGSGNK